MDLRIWLPICLGFVLELRVAEYKGLVEFLGKSPDQNKGIHVWHMSTLTEIFGDDFVLQFDGGTLGHSWENPLSAVANRVVLEVCVQVGVILSMTGSQATPARLDQNSTRKVREHARNNYMYICMH
ncbi:hypothetical protein GQ457_06G020760 [Hibiscus cannabinus]